MSKTNCYEGDTKPPNGWIVACDRLKQFAIVTDLSRLAWAIGVMQDDADRLFPDQDNPVLCFELGRELAVRIDYAIDSIQPKDTK